METCPWCGGQMKEKNYELVLSRKRWSIFNAIRDAGSDGATEDELMVMIGDNRSKVTLRTTIYQINRQIAPLAIRRKNGAYRLYSQ